MLIEILYFMGVCKSFFHFIHFLLMLPSLPCPYFAEMFAKSAGTPGKTVLYSKNEAAGGGQVHGNQAEGLQ